MAIEEIKRIATHALTECGADPPPGFATKLAEGIAKALGGTRVYFSRCPLDKATRHRLIFEEFNGANMRQVCERYRVSARTVYRVINAARKPAHLP